MNKILLLLAFCPLWLHAQTPLQGIINGYAKVTYVGNNVAKVTTVTPFTISDTVLIIQMQGVTIDSSNTAAYGSLASYNNAGFFEFLTIRCISGDSVYFSSNLTKAYTPSGSVQLVRVPHYSKAIVTDTLTAQSWNGQTGGVLAFTVGDTLQLSANIDVSGKGFRGGTISNNPDGSCGAGYTDYYYSIGQGVAAEKGEGAALALTNKTAGRGAQANGGGGGNKHNSGGGGGGNFTAGGTGGNTMSGCAPAAVGGKGGYALTTANSRIFMGGGGGCSDNNNGVGTPGTNGGGIIIISAGSIAGNGKAIRANGRDQGYINNNIGDGAGGGGGGGSILLQAGNYLNSPVEVNTNGGHGGDQYTSYGANFGPGGGGGAGNIWLNGLAMPGSMTASTSPGTSGKIIGPPNNASLGQAYGATDGAAGNGIRYNLNLQFPLPAPPPANPGMISDTLVGCRKVKLTAAGGTTGAAYNWNFGDGTTASGNPVIHQYLQTGSFTVLLTASTGLPCAAPVAKNITVNGTGLNAGITDSIINCKTVRLKAATAMLPSGLLWLWGDGSSSTANPAVHGYAQPGPHTATLIVTNGTGCADTILHPILFTYNAPILAAGDTTICPGDAAQLNAYGGVSYSWQPAALLDNAAIGQPVAHPVTQTMFVVTGIDTNGCTGLDTVLIGLYSPPVIQAVTDGKQITCTNARIQLFASGAARYLWQPAVWCDDSTGSSPFVSPPVATIFTVTGTDLNGCSASTTVGVTSVKDAAVYMPDAFSPNHDGINDVIFPHMVCDCAFSGIDIYNRWSELVFSTYAPHHGWDGTYHGAPQPMGVYHYIIRCKKSNGETHMDKGEFTLIR